MLYCLGAVLVGFIVLPLLVASSTPFTYWQVIKIVREPMITAFATGKLIIVLPLLIANTEKMLADIGRETGEDKNELELLYATAYAFPHVGKLLSMLFIPFTAWFVGTEISSVEYPSFLVSGLFAYFGGPIVAMPFLLDQMHLPHDMFQLFLFSGVIGERVGDAVGAMHLGVFVLLTLSALRGSMTVHLRGLVRLGAVAIATTLLTLALANNMLSRFAGMAETKSQTLERMQLIERPVGSVVIMDAEPNPVSREANETVIERIRRRGVMRVGFNEDKLPFAFFNEHDDLVGFDVNLAHALAHDLGVLVEFVRFDRATLAEQVHNDHFDFVMSGLVGTLERSEAMQHSASYMDVTLGLVVPDHRAREFKSLSAIGGERESSNRIRRPQSRLRDTPDGGAAGRPAD